MSQEINYGFIADLTTKRAMLMTQIECIAKSRLPGHVSAVAGLCARIADIDGIIATISAPMPSQQETLAA